MIEWKDIISWFIGGTGWALAAWQYWRNDLQRRPLVSIVAVDPTASAQTWAFTVNVYNRGPWNVTVTEIEIIQPVSARLVALESPHDGKRHARSGQVNWLLEPYSSGEFPVRGASFDAALPADLRDVVIEVGMVINRDTWSSRRLSKRKRFQRTNRKQEP